MSSQSLYINSIDECVNNIVDSFYLEIIEDKQLKKKLDSPDYIVEISNFKKLKDKINLLIIKNVESFKINEIITNKIEYDKIIILFTDYVLLYYFFYLGLNSDLNKVLDTLNKLNAKLNDDFFKNRYLTQYGIYYKYIKDYYLVFTNLDRIGLVKNESNADQIFIKEHEEIIKQIQSMDIEEYSK